MDNNDDIGQDGEQLISRANAEQVLHRVGLDAEQIVAVLDGIEFPCPVSKIIPRALQHGVSLTSLTDRMGGSP
jgi:hypothetical protein